jgi:hypothetical protein
MMNCAGYLKVLDQYSGTNAKKNHDNCSTAWDLKPVPLGYTSKVTPRLWERSLMPLLVHLIWNWRITDIHYGMHVHPFHCKGPHSLWWDCSRAVRGTSPPKSLCNFHSIYTVYEFDPGKQNATWRAAVWSTGHYDLVRCETWPSSSNIRITGK